MKKSNSDKLNEECGVFGISNHEDASALVALGLHALQHRGQEAILCLMGRGIGEATAQRILRKVPRNNRDGLFKAIHNAEVEYARTRRFWG